MRDTIYRQQAIDAIEKAKSAKTENGEIYVAKINAEMNIQVLPPAQPEVTEEAVKEYCRKRNLCVVDSALLKKYESEQAERKKGKWIDDGKGLYMCSSCGKLWAHWWTSAVPLNQMYKELKFCPNCGHPMGDDGDEWTEED